MRWTFAALLAVTGFAVPLGGVAKAPPAARGLTILYTADERGEISPCG
jgi:hypothetical protein